MVGPQRAAIPVGDDQGFKLGPIERADDGGHQAAGIALRDDVREVVFYGQHELTYDVEHTSRVVKIIVDLAPGGQMPDLLLALQDSVACSLFGDAKLDVTRRI